jgi:hypothetical protein
MRQILNIDSTAHQRHTLLFDEFEITVELRFLSPVQIWTMNIDYKGWSIKGIKLSCGVLHIRGANQPFDFVCVDNLGIGQDPFRITDFEDDRCSIFLLEPGDMLNIRGISVQI